jgi:hypothetical protein
MTSLELGAMCTAGVSGVAMAWSNIKGIFARLESLIIVKAELNGSNMKDNFMDYCWARFRSSPLGVRRFQSGDYFIRPKNRWGTVASESTGKFITFWKGWRPLFISVGESKGNGASDMTSVSFIRGTFDLESLIVDATNAHDVLRHDKSGATFRYYVKRCFGSKKKHGEGEPSGGLTQAVSKSPSNSDGWKPLFYAKEDIGVPTSNKPMDNLAYDEKVLEFYQEAVRWKESKDWFKEKGLNWRFGAGLFGPAGTGKSSLAKALGQSLDVPIHSYDLTTMDNEDLVDNWRNSLGESPCIVLLEDADRIFDENRQIKTAKDKSPLTLDCLLNCISGVQPSDGILVLVTANDPSKLDPALGVPEPDGKSTRPGRLDRAVFVGNLNEEGRYKIAKRILSDCLELVDKTVLEGDGETGAQFESRCSKLALDQYWGRLKIDQIEKEVPEKVEERLYN